MERIPSIGAIFFFLNLLKYYISYLFCMYLKKKKKKVFKWDLEYKTRLLVLFITLTTTQDSLWYSLLHSNVLPNHFGHFSSIMNRLCIRFYFTLIHISFVSFLSANIYSLVLSCCFTFICIKMYVTHYPRGCT